MREASVWLRRPGYVQCARAEHGRKLPARGPGRSGSPLLGVSCPGRGREGMGMRCRRPAWRGLSATAYAHSWQQWAGRSVALCDRRGLHFENPIRHSRTTWDWLSTVAKAEVVIVRGDSGGDHHPLRGPHRTRTASANAWSNRTEAASATYPFGRHLRMRREEATVSRGAG